MTGHRVVRPARPDNQACLHCVLHRGIERWVAKYGERNAAGVPIADMGEIIVKIAEVMADLVYTADEPGTIAQFEAYARQCLEAGFKHAATGELVEVSTGSRQQGVH